MKHYQGIILLNIPSWGGGGDPWGSGDDKVGIGPRFSLFASCLGGFICWSQQGGLAQAGRVLSATSLCCAPCPRRARMQQGLFRPSFSDGYLEVVAVHGVMHLSQISTHVRHAKRLGQVRMVAACVTNETFQRRRALSRPACLTRGFWHGAVQGAADTFPGARAHAH